jgi:hypothetical protein
LQITRELSLNLEKDINCAKTELMQKLESFDKNFKGRVTKMPKEGKTLLKQIKDTKSQQRKKKHK